MQFDNIRQDKAEDIFKFFLKSANGQYVLKYLHNVYTAQPVAQVGVAHDQAFFREGQNSIIRLMFDLSKMKEKDSND